MTIIRTGTKSQTEGVWAGETIKFCWLYEVFDAVRNIQSIYSLQSFLPLLIMSLTVLINFSYFAWGIHWKTRVSCYKHLVENFGQNNVRTKLGPNLDWVLIKTYKKVVISKIISVVVLQFWCHIVVINMINLLAIYLRLNFCFKNSMLVDFGAIFRPDFGQKF